MNLTKRMWLSGALLPLLVMALVWLGADRLYRLALERALDQALLAQAAIESVSLFDGPGRKPHLHMATSPLVDSVRPFAPQGALFGPDGRIVMRYPVEADPVRAEVLMPGTPSQNPALTTGQSGNTRTRVLTVSVASPDGRPYTLRLTATMAQLDAAVGTLRQLALLSLLAGALVLVAVQTVQARKLSRRLRTLTAHAAELRRGVLDHALSPESDRDELAELRDVLIQATQALKLARDAEDRLLADAAHELRTPLTLMRTSLDLALRRERSPEELRWALSETRDEVDRLAHLSTSLLDMAAVQHAERLRGPCDIGSVLRGAVEAAQGEAEARGIILKWDTPSPAEATANAESVRQAMDNLLGNALKYAHSEIHAALTQDADGWLLRVRDDGPGIPAEERTLVFEPFHRIAGSAPGAGLGLSIVREVARAHGGHARVVPVDRGALLELWLARS